MTDYNKVKEKMLEIVKSLRAELKWNDPGYYATDADYARCQAKEETINEICETIERVFEDDKT